MNVKCPKCLNTITTHGSTQMIVLKCGHWYCQSCLINKIPYCCYKKTMVTDYIFPKFDFTENENKRSRNDQAEMTENDKREQIKIERKRTILVFF